MGENSEAAVRQIEKRVSDAGSGAIDDNVRRDIEQSLQTNSVDTPEERRIVNTQLEASGTLPTLMLDQRTQDQFYQKFGNDKRGLDETKLKAGAEDPNESPLNRMLAQAMVDRFRTMDADGREGVSRDEMRAWAATTRGANMPTDNGGNNMTVDPPTGWRNPSRVERNNVNGERETITKNPDGSYNVERRNSDGSQENVKAKNFQMRSDGSYTYETEGGAKVEQRRDGTRVVTGPTGDTTTTVTDKQGNVTSLEHKDSSGRLSERIERQPDGTYKATLNGGTGGHFEVKNVKVNGGTYSYEHNGTTYTQSTETDKRVVTRGNQETTYTFGADGKPDSIEHKVRGADGNQTTQFRISREGDKYFHTDDKGNRTEVQQPSVWQGGMSFKSADGKRETTLLNDGTRKEAQVAENGDKRTTTTRADGSTETETTSADGKTTRKVTKDKDGNVTSIEDRNATTTTTIVPDGNGGFTRTIKTNDGSKPDVTAPVSDVKANDDGTYSYKQKVNNRTFTFDSQGGVSYDVVRGDSLWKVSRDLLEMQLGRKPTNREIANSIREIARENGISNPNRINVGQQFRLRKAA